MQDVTQKTSQTDLDIIYTIININAHKIDDDALVERKPMGMRCPGCSVITITWSIAFIEPRTVLHTELSEHSDRQEDNIAVSINDVDPQPQEVSMYRALLEMLMGDLPKPKSIEVGTKSIFDNL